MSTTLQLGNQSAPLTPEQLELCDAFGVKKPMSSVVSPSMRMMLGREAFVECHRILESTVKTICKLSPEILDELRDHFVRSFSDRVIRVNSGHAHVGRTAFGGIGQKFRDSPQGQNNGTCDKDIFDNIAGFITKDVVITSSKQGVITEQDITDKSFTERLEACTAEALYRSSAIVYETFVPAMGSPMMHAQPDTPASLRLERLQSITFSIELSPRLINYPTSLYRLQARLPHLLDDFPMLKAVHVKVVHHQDSTYTHTLRARSYARDAVNSRTFEDELQTLVTAYRLLKVNKKVLKVASERIPSSQGTTRQDMRALEVLQIIPARLGAVAFIGPI